MKNGKVIAVAGKGGTGKTAIAALLLRELLSGHGDRTISILAVDADADSNLPDALGVACEKSLGDIREQLLEEKQRNIALDLRSQFEGKIAAIMAEEDRYDLLVMGRPEGPGCYCPVNHIIRMIIDTLAQNYDYTIIDCEAGLEHLSRRTTRDVDIMLVVLDRTRKSFKTAVRLQEIAREIDVDVKRLLIVANKIPEGAADELRAAASTYGIEIDEIIPFDPLISEYDAQGRPVVDLPDDAPAVIAVRQIVEKIR
ncbi:MAG TPA: ATP-binding protein [Methanomicrobia archaeon]|nr:ATP-binding protein [Methanomicrobia archaeon]